MITVTRYHDFSCGHRVVGHEGKCALLHGHNYRAHFTAIANELDAVGRVIDFSVLKSKLCYWLEDNWDHKFLAWTQDTAILALEGSLEGLELLNNSIVWLPFNPTAEAMADYLLHNIGSTQLSGTNVWLKKVVIEETRKCSAEASL